MSGIRKAGNFFRPVLRGFFGLFFDRKYLAGRYFDVGFKGYKWALRALWCRNILRLAPTLPWPAVLGLTISRPANIRFHPDDLNNFQSPGVYMQNFDGVIEVGRGSYIAPNVGLITANHQIDRLDDHEKGRDIVIGEMCWIGMNSVILPGVILGPRTIVAAGAVVNSSFPDGKVVIGGVPAKVLKTL